MENKLDSVLQKVVEKAITDIVSEYTSETKLFTADTLHFLRSKITQKVKEAVGDEVIKHVDVGLDLTKVEDIQFFFKVSVPIEDKKDNAPVQE